MPLFAFLTRPVLQTTQLVDGNPIFTPTNGEKVPVGKPYGVTWKPTTNGTVTILLISGATQGTLGALYPIVETTPNSGSFSWTPKTDLPEGKVYGLQLIDDATGQFQCTSASSFAPPMLHHGPQFVFPQKKRKKCVRERTLVRRCALAAPFCARAQTSRNQTPLAPTAYITAHCLGTTSLREPDQRANLLLPRSSPVTQCRKKLYRLG